MASSPLLAADAPPLASPKDALGVMDFEAAARRALPPAHFAYQATGVDDDATLRANREAWNAIKLRPRRVIDVRTADPRVEVLGETWDWPVALAPVGNMKAFHDECELAAARAAAARRTRVVLSTVCNTPVEEVARAAGTPVWFQLYATSRWEATERLVRRAEAAGCPVLVLTVDTPAGRNTETLSRAERIDNRPCGACHPKTGRGFFTRKPMFDGIDVDGLSVAQPAMTWDFVRRVKALSRMKLVIKGIETREDARLCREHGVDGIVVSNHGGRAEESGRGTAECLPEVVDGAAGLPVLVDGGIRRGNDVFKALALGAKGVLIGRPYIWGLAAFGQAGVDRVLEILRAEFVLTMKHCGVTEARAIGRSAVV